MMTDNNSRENIVKALRMRAQEQYAAKCDLMKRIVGEGDEYENGLVRIVVSPNGAYYEFLELPEEFAGVGGDEVRKDLIGDQESLKFVNRIYDLIPKLNTDNSPLFQFMVLYSTDIFSEQDCYMINFSSDPRFDQLMAERGKIQRDKLPLFYKLKAKSKLISDLFSTDSTNEKTSDDQEKGIVIYFASKVGDLNILVRAELPADASDLANESAVIH